MSTQLPCSLYKRFDFNKREPQRFEKRLCRQLTQPSKTQVFVVVQLRLRVCGGLPTTSVTKSLVTNKTARVPRAAQT